MISAVADSCSVRLDKVNGKVYKFHALVFSPGKFVFWLLHNVLKRSGCLQLLIGSAASSLVESIHDIDANCIFQF